MKASKLMLVGMIGPIEGRLINRGINRGKHRILALLAQTMVLRPTAGHIAELVCVEMCI
jgi:hypothetical protein